MLVNDPSGVKARVVIEFLSSQFLTMLNTYMSKSIKKFHTSSL